MTDAQKRVKVGDDVTLSTITGHRSITVKVMATLPIGILASGGAAGNYVLFYPWECVPDPPMPKAKPGVRYRLTNTLITCDRIGTADGRLAAFNQRLTAPIIPFDTDWVEVTE